MGLPFSFMFINVVFCIYFCQHKEYKTNAVCSLLRHVVSCSVVLNQGARDVFVKTMVKAM